MILVTGATGFLGKRVCKRLDELEIQYKKTSLSMGVDLRERSQVDSLLASVRPTKLLNCAAYVGGIQFGYKHSAELFTNNLLMTINILEAAKKYGVSRIVNPISNCAYPAEATLFREEEFWDGPLHESVMVYGFVRKASWVGSWAFNKQYGLDVINLILSNMYGPEDHFEEERSHALGALVMKIVKAHREGLPKVSIWGTGKPVREWLYVDDATEALIKALDIPPYLDPINVGIGEGISILEMAEIIKKKVGFKGALELDPSKPDGAPYKTVNGEKGRTLLKWEPKMGFNEGITQTINWYIKNEC